MLEDSLKESRAARLSLEALVASATAAASMPSSEWDSMAAGHGEEVRAVNYDRHMRNVRPSPPPVLSTDLAVGIIGFISLIYTSGPLELRERASEYAGKLAIGLPCAVVAAAAGAVVDASLAPTQVYPEGAASSVRS